MSSLLLHHLIIIFFTLSLLITQTLSSSNPNNNNNITLLINTPFKLLSSTSFTTHFSFSLSPHSTLSLLLRPNSAFPVNHFRIVFHKSFLTVENVSVPWTINGDVYNVVVDYWAGSKTVEVRVGKTGPNSIPKLIDPSLPDRPLLVFPIDLSGMWEGEEILVGLQSSSNSCDIYSWKFKARNVPKGMHSMPVDPSVRVKVRAGSKDVPCYLTVVSAVMIAAGCCVFVVFVVMFFKVISTDWDEVMEMEYVLKPVGKGYEKIVSVDVENNMNGNVKG